MNSLKNDLKYIPYFLSHPINGFWEIKKEKKGSLLTAILIFVSYLLVMIASAFFTATLFNKNDVFQINIWKIIFPIILLFLLWCVSSWSLTSLFDGEGNFQDIFIATAYALIPILITELALIFISHGIVLEEAAFYDLLRGIGIVWTGFLLFMGMIVTHQYTFLKSILISLFSILGICIIIYVGLLFINLLQQMTGFGVGLYTEWSLRHQ